MADFLSSGYVSRVSRVSVSGSVNSGHCASGGGVDGHYMDAQNCYSGTVVSRCLETLIER